MKTIRTYINVAEAGFAASLLEAAGIMVLLNGEESFLMTPGLATGGIRLQVEKEDEERALRLLDEGFDAEENAPRLASSVSESTGSENSEKGRIPVGLFVAGLATLALLWFTVQQWREKELRRTSVREETVNVDYNRDGKDDRFETYRYGMLSHYEVDRNYDGRIDSWVRCDSEGRDEFYELDQNYDGAPDYWSVYRNGELQSWRRDTDFDGRSDQFGQCEGGQPVSADFRPGDSKVVIRRQFFANEILKEEQVDEDLDGKMDYRIVFDPFGAPSEHLPINDRK